MEITKTKQGDSLTVSLDGRLDTITSKQLEKELRNDINGIAELEFDLEKLVYITSAGLRILATAQKVMSKQGSMIIRNAQPEVMEIFEVTGLTDVFDIQ